jgi:hypothetical protein
VYTIPREFLSLNTQSIGAIKARLSKTR